MSLKHRGPRPACSQQGHQQRAVCWLPGAGRHPLHLFFSHQETLPALFRQQAKQPARIHMEDVSHRAKRNRHLSAPPAETAAARTGRRSEEVSKKSPSSRGGEKSQKSQNGNGIKPSSSNQGEPQPLPACQLY